MVCRMSRPYEGLGDRFNCFSSWLNARCRSRSGSGCNGWRGAIALLKICSTIANSLPEPKAMVSATIEEISENLISCADHCDRARCLWGRGNRVFSLPLWSGEIEGSDRHLTQTLELQQKQLNYFDEEQIQF